MPASRLPRERRAEPHGQSLGPTTLTVEPQLIGEIVTRVLQEMAERGGQPEPGLAEHRRITDTQARTQLYGGYSRSGFLNLMALPGAPPAVQLGGRTSPKLRLVRDHLRFLAPLKSGK